MVVEGADDGGAPAVSAPRTDGEGHPVIVRVVRMDDMAALLYTRNRNNPAFGDTR